MKITDTLQRARDLMRDGHWCRGRNYNHGNYCLVGAIRAAATGDPYGNSLFTVKVIDHVMKFIPDTYLSYFNDTHEWIDVDTLLTHAIDKAKET